MFQSILLSTYFNFQQVPEEYAGESSWIGRLGQLLIISAFILAIASIVFYILAERHHKKGTNHAIWTRQGRLAFILHTVSVISTFGLLLYMIIGQYYEYDYVSVREADIYQSFYIHYNIYLNNNKIYTKHV